MEQTLGQKRVKADFNPAKNELVDKIKNKAAEFIDLVEEMRRDSEGQVTSLDIQRYVSIAQTDMETACMYAVKANFTK